MVKYINQLSQVCMEIPCKSALGKFSTLNIRKLVTWIKCLSTNANAVVKTSLTLEKNKNTIPNTNVTVDAGMTNKFDNKK